MAVTIVGNNTPTAGSVVYGDGANYASTAAGTSGQFLQSTGSGVPIWAAAGPEIVRVARTSNTALDADNKGNLIAITSGTFTQTFVAAATLGNGWFAYIQNSGTGDITLDPDDSETIDGLTSYIMYPGEVRLVQCDGTAFFSVVLTPFFKTFTASGTFAKPPGYSKYAGLLWGAGGSGRKDTASNDKCGGGGGACAPIDFLASSLGATEAVTIGAGGAAVAGTADGNAGGYSEFAGVYAYGGRAGRDTNGYGGSAFVDNTLITDNQIYGGGIGNSDEDYPFYGGGGANLVENESHAIYGGAAGGSSSGGTSVLNDQTTIFGGAGGLAVAGGAGGTAGTAPGGGGGATRTGTASGAGARGELRIWGVA